MQVASRRNLEGGLSDISIERLGKEEGEAPRPTWVNSRSSTIQFEDCHKALFTALQGKWRVNSD